MGMAAHGHPTRMGRVWVVLYAHGLRPWVTRLVMGRVWVRVYARRYPWVARLILIIDYNIILHDLDHNLA